MGGHSNVDNYDSRVDNPIYLLINMSWLALEYSLVLCGYSVDKPGCCGDKRLFAFLFNNPPSF
jgi:hypothetical protein